METKELKINAPDGYEIDRENSTFGCIKFKPKKSKFSDYDGKYRIEGWGIADNHTVYRSPRRNSLFTKDTFATEKQAKSVLAMAQISQIMVNDERFGGVVTNLEWNDVTMTKRCIIRCGENLIAYDSELNYQFLAFHTEEQRELFIEENEDLVKDYLMFD